MESAKNLVLPLLNAIVYLNGRAIPAVKVRSASYITATDIFDMTIITICSFVYMTIKQRKAQHITVSKMCKAVSPVQAKVTSTPQ